MHHYPLDAENCRTVAETELQQDVVRQKNVPLQRLHRSFERTDFSMKRLSGVLLLIAGFAMMCAGLLRGEAAIILQKAIVLCLECIGLG